MALLLFGCAPRQAPETIKGAESTELRRRVRGFVVKAGRDAQTQEVQGLLGISLETGNEFVIKEAGGISTVGGPDSACRVVYIEGNQFSSTLADRMCLKRIGLDGKNDETIFCRTGRAGKVLGDHLALSPDGQWAAVIDHPQKDSMPGAYLERGTLEIWDLGRKQVRLSGIAVLHTERRTIAWFPDSRRLLFVDWVPRSSLSTPPGDEKRRSASWDRVPAVHVLDPVTGHRRMLASGWSAIVGLDGTSILVDGLDGRVRLVDERSGTFREVSWKGRRRAQQLALLEGGIVLYRGLPTEGTPVHFTKHGSFRAGTPMATLKAARLDTQEFQTVAPAVDWRHHISFGVCDQHARRHSRVGP